MGPKQREMDEIIEKLYNRLCRNDDRNDGQKTLFVILGDHGMNNLGNHGGSSTGETSPAMIFASPSFKSFQMKDDHKDSFVAGGAAKVRGYSLFDPEFVNRIIKDLDSGDRLGPTHGFIRQVDLVPTLSTLFCLPIPKMNIGQVIPALFRNEADLSRAKMQNIMQISRLMGVQADTISSDFSKIVQDLNHAVTGYDYGKLWIGMVMALATFLITYSRPLTGPSKETGKFSYLDTFGLFCVVMGMQAIHPLWWLISALGSSIILYGQIGSFEEVRKSLVGVESKLMTILLGFSGISMFSSSFVEEEYLTWNFICSTMALVNILWWWDRGGFQVFEYCLLLVSLRLGMSFNATGYQWIDAPSLQSFFLHQPAYYLDILYSLAIIFFIFNVKRYPSIMIRLLSIVSCLIAWTYSVIPIERVRDLFPMVQDSVWLGRSFYVVFVLLFNQGFRLRSDLMNRHFLDCLVITSFLLQKKLNVILIVAMHYILSGIKYQEQGDIFFYCLARYLFYAVGNSNGIATVDISHSYIGLAEFQYYLTGFITSYNWLFTPLLLFGWANLYCYEDERLRLLVKAFSQLYGRQRAKSEPNLELSLTRATEILSMASPSSVNPNLAKSRKCLKGFILFHMFYEMMVIFSCFHFRGHLFVWSVFAPKIIVEIGWALVVWVYVCLQVGLQSNTFLMDLIVIDSKTFLSTTNND